MLWLNTVHSGQLFFPNPTLDIGPGSSLRVPSLCRQLRFLPATGARRSLLPNNHQSTPVLRNRLLTQLTAAEYLRLEPELEQVPVSLAAINLQDAGLIRYSRGTMHILDRKNLEAVACDCYATIRAQTGDCVGP